MAINIVLSEDRCELHIYMYVITGASELIGMNSGTSFATPFRCFSTAVLN